MTKKIQNDKKILEDKLKGTFTKSVQVAVQDVFPFKEGYT